MSDFSKSEFQIFFSGVESDKYFGIVTKETNAVLMSYLYIQRKGKKFLQERFKQNPELRIMIDSGAHTFIQKEDEYRKIAERHLEKHGTDYWEDYLEKYVAFARENKEHVFAVVELDIDYLVGEDKVEEYREKYFKPLEEEGIQVIYVWHNIRGEKDWERMCQKYSYTGFSLQGDKDLTLDRCSRMVNIAKKYGTKVHGFAATGMDFLIKIPFYTVDSTTWLVGTQFGELNYFDGRKMTRLKKDKWKRQYKNKLIQLGANWNLAEREEPYELIRINVLTFLQVQEYVRKIMKNKMYWLEGRKTVEDKPKKIMPPREVIDVKEIDLPDREWFDGESEEYEDYAKDLGIDINLSKDDILYWLELFYAFIKFDKEFIEKCTDEEIFNIIDIFGLKNEINTRKKALEILPKCFKDHACGLRHDLENYAEKQAKAGEAPERAKEREEYYNEPDNEIVDVEKEECDSILSQFLPQGSDMPEVEQYDEELKKVGILPVRDEKGRFVKGQKAVRKPKQMYSNLMPKLSCDTCIRASNCPDYVAGYVCAYNKMFKRFDTRNSEDVLDAMHSMVQHNLTRMQIQMMYEMLDGGVADPNVTAMINQNMQLLQTMNNIQSQTKQVVATRKVVVDEKGNTEVVETVSANPQQGGILSKIFGANTQTQKTPEDNDIIDVTPIKEKE